MSKEGTKLVATFAKNNFISAYLQVVKNNNLAELATWLLKNSRYMDKTMFFNSENDWNQFLPIHILTLRAYTPSGVFNTTSEAGYLTRVGNNPELASLSSYLFLDDFIFVESLPSELKNQMIQLIQIVYRKGIRKEDQRVKAM